VSRVTPVQTALRNCTRDEGRPFEVGNQVLISSHRKLLSSKAMVVIVAETSGLDSDRQGWERRAQANCCSAAADNRYGHRDATMILIAFRHGFRASELCDLR